MFSKWIKGSKSGKVMALSALQAPMALAHTITIKLLSSLLISGQSRSVRDLLDVMLACMQFPRLRGKN